jgi:hypothetical protein
MMLHALCPMHGGRRHSIPNKPVQVAEQIMQALTGVIQEL